MTSQQVYSDWKQQPITKEVFTGIARRIEDLKEELAFSAGIDPIQDALKRGAITALRDILNMEYVEGEANE